MKEILGCCKLPTDFSLGDKFDTSKVFDMTGMFAKAKLPEGFILGEKFTFGTAINPSNMFCCVEFPKRFSLNDFTFTANRDYADMFSGCKFPVGFPNRWFPYQAIGKNYLCIYIEDSTLKQCMVVETLPCFLMLKN